eukprot:TRINITY_DN6375_c0_g1::TRINITY_DN6375_c0_g1_i1::g.590::m.590 TRINITY_DN6375_c0_g1::TRINITY_DN6375_c0_g1_i1::g.590  ORF type:complete len:303 (+),score=22.91,sp/Q6DBR4/TIPIN_DANRE/26.05/3e-11,Swi3/PF07962.7/3.4e-06,Swi3/PF07962.7/9.6e+03 TRINITY_DN6375_c0_g1_i1:26-910(+)
MMSSQSQSQSRKRKNNDQNTTNTGASATTDDAAAPTIVKPRKPRKKAPKFTPSLLFKDDGGLVSLHSVMYKQKWLPEGYETKNMDLLISNYERWMEKLVPGINPEALAEEMEEMGATKSVILAVDNVRMAVLAGNAEKAAGLQQALAQHQPQDDVDPEAEAGVIVAEAQADELEDQWLAMADDQMPIYAEPMMDSRPSLPSPPHQEAPAPPPPQLTDEQKARIERNKQLALERRRAKQLEQQQQQHQTTNTVPAPSTTHNSTSASKSAPSSSSSVPAHNLDTQADTLPESLSFS